MSFITPALLAVGLLAAPIILLYMLRLRRRRVLVSSTLLWQKLLRDREANAPWQRLRRNLLLFLQLLILAALVLALARPFIPIPSLASGNVVVLLDGSASMQATDVEPSRFEIAKSEMRRLINDLRGNSQMTIIEVGHSPHVLASAETDKDVLRQSLELATPTAGEADWPAAFALASGAAQGFRDARILLISDGGLPDDLPPLSAETVFISVGERGENLSIAAMATRDTQSGPELFASVANQGLLDRDALFTLFLDGVLYDSRRIQIPAGSATDLTWRLPRNTVIIEGRLGENEEDYLELDDRAWAVHEGGLNNRALLVTEGNLFLEQALSVLPGLEVFKTSQPDDLLDSDGEAYDLYVFDGSEPPDSLPASDLLIIDPPVNAPIAASSEQLLTVSDVFSDTIAVQLSDTPLMRFVDWRNVHISTAKVVSAPWAQSLVTAEGGPLILAGERLGQRVVVITFDLHDSDLPLQIAFPILMANITDWLSPGRAFDSPAGIRSGMPIAFSPGVSTSAVAVQKPDGNVTTIEVDEESVIFAETYQLGLYRIGMIDASGERAGGTFAVNLFSPMEAEIMPTSTLQTGQIAIAAASDGAVGQREFWPVLVAVAFMVLLIEWWVHYRGTKLPNPISR
jgi:Ca-activated chloride channel family protein